MQLDPESLFTQRVRELRLERGWSQAQLAERARQFGLDVHPTAITRIESGRRSVSLNDFMSLCGAFEWSPEDMLASLRTTAELTAGLEFHLPRVKEDLQTPLGTLQIVSSLLQLAQNLTDAAVRDAGLETESLFLPDVDAVDEGAPPDGE